MSIVRSNERISLSNKKKTSSRVEFAKMRRWFPDRVTIASEGDSWFAYPPKWILAGKPSNLIDHISSRTGRKANFYSMASNGDEAVDMVSGKQKHDLIGVLRWHVNRGEMKPVQLLLFSGGGNDIVGENDFERFVNSYKDGDTAADCVNQTRLKRKAKQIGLAYEELLDIRDHYTPETVILTHTYDYPYPSLQGGEFLGGLIKTKGWMKRFMDDAGIPDELQCDVIKIFMNTLADVTLKIAKKRRGFIVVETRETLKGKKYWLNEIHPTSKGFGLIAKRMFKEIKQRFPGLR